MITSGISQFFVISLFLMLGVLLYVYAEINGIQAPQKSDELFPMIATQGYFPVIVGILFVVGLISSAYSAAGSALTALTTSFTVDILGVKGKSEDQVVRLRKRVHVGMAVVMSMLVIVVMISMIVVMISMIVSMLVIMVMAMLMYMLFIFQMHIKIIGLDAAFLRCSKMQMIAIYPQTCQRILQHLSVCPQIKKRSYGHITADS